MSKFRVIVESILYNNLLLESEQKVNWILSQPKLVQALESRIQNDSKAPDGITVEQLLKNFDNNSVVIGKFLPWVVKMYSNDEFEYTDLNLVNNYLENFTKSINKLDKKDINQYKSLEELNAALESIKDIKGSREARRDAKANAEKIYEDNKWIILIPHTKEAAIQYGKHTKWCTAGVNDNMFDHYSKDGPLYIIINKLNPNEKYQFHFESGQYKDAENEEIDLKIFLIKNPKIEKFFRSIRNFNKDRYTDWIWLDNKLNYDDCFAKVKEEGFLLKFVPNKFRDYDMCFTAIKDNGLALKFVPDESIDYNMCLEAVKNDGWALNFVPDEFIDYNLCLEAVKEDGWVLKWVPEKFIDYNLCLEAVKNNYSALKFVPDEFRKKIEQEVRIKI